MSEQTKASIIVNADDWGRDIRTTDRIFECLRRAKISSVSAMVFMEDSERSAELAAAHAVDAGLHLNLTTPFSAARVPNRLKEQQEKISCFLRRSSLARVLYHPGLAPCFESVVKAQLDEFARLYGSAARRVDGHHHQHLCANVLVQRLLPAGAIVRRNFYFASGEKSVLNRAYRALQDRRLARRHPLAGRIYCLPPLDPERLRRVAALGCGLDVEIITHPVNDPEFDFLLEGGLERIAADIVADGFALRFSSLGSEHSRSTK